MEYTVNLQFMYLQSSGLSTHGVLHFYSSGQQETRGTPACPITLYFQRQKRKRWPPSTASCGLLMTALRPWSVAIRPASTCAGRAGLARATASTGSFNCLSATTAHSMHV